MLALWVAVTGGLVVLFRVLGWTWATWAIIGASVIGFTWFLTAALNATDGTWLKRQGGAAEELTSQALRRFRRDGWRVVDAVPFKDFDVDHVLVGPGGIWAIETKNSMVPMKIRPDGIDLYGGDACVQARQAAQKIAHLLKSGGLDFEVLPALVLWGPGAPKLEQGFVALSAPAGEVLAFEGTKLRLCRDQFSRSELSLADAAAAYEVVTSFVARRDDYERAR